MPDTTTPAAVPPPNPVKFLAARETEWAATTPQQVAGSASDSAEKAEKEKAEKARAGVAQKRLHEMLASALSMPNLLVLSGSGTSLGDVGGPSMWTLWKAATWADAQAADDTAEPLTSVAKRILEKVGYKPAAKKENIEELLSRCNAYLAVHDGAADVADFVKECEAKIVKLCGFIQEDKPGQLDAHKTFLRRMARRHVRNSRLKLFTTNYDLCFERAASGLGLMAVDGFSYATPRRFDPRYFAYDLVRRSQKTEAAGDFVEGVFHLLKLHGSVNWNRANGEITQQDKPETPCLIYPARSKYQQSYGQPHLELMSQFLASLREPNTCLIVMGFGFNDDHLSEPILSALQSNPFFKLIVVDSKAEERTKETGGYWQRLSESGKNGDDVLFIQATFQQISSEIPDLKALTPAEQIVKAMRRMEGGR